MNKAGVKGKIQLLNITAQRKRLLLQKLNDINVFISGNQYASQGLTTNE